MKSKLALFLMLCIFSACTGRNAKQTSPEKPQEPAAKSATLNLSVPQEYSGNVPFKNSKNVRMNFILSADATTITQIKLDAEQLLLSLKGEMSGISVNMNGGFTDTTAYALTDGKLLVNRLFLTDLTVTNACIYGTIGLEIEQDSGMTFVTKPVYVVLPNITTPQEIPAGMRQQEK